MTGRLQLFEDVVRLETRMWNQLDQVLKDEHDLSMAWLLALRVLEAAPGGRVLDLAQDLGISPGGASKLVDRLVGAGLVTRAPDEEDRRASRLHLTPAGGRATRAASATSETWLQRRFDAALGARRTGELAGLVGALRAHDGAGPGAL